MLLVAGLVFTLPLEVLLGARVYRRPALLAGALGPVLAVAVVAEVVGVRRELWVYDARRLAGLPTLAGAPAEALIRLLGVGVGALLVYEGLGVLRRRATAGDGQPRSRRRGARA